MQTFTQWVTDMGAKLDEKYLGPIGQEVSPANERVIGDVSPETRRIYGVFLQLHAKLHALVATKNSELATLREAGTLTQAVINAGQREIDGVTRRAETVKKLFWAEARHELNCFDVEGIGIRGERTLVEVPPEEESDLMSPSMGIVVVSDLGGLWRGGNPFGRGRNPFAF